MEKEDLSILALHLVQDIGPRRFSNLIKHFGSAVEALNADISELANVEEIGRKTAEKIINLKNTDAVEKEVELAKKLGVAILTQNNIKYPKQLKELYDAPAVIYVKGDLKESDYLSVAMVGTRQPTQYGKSAAARFAADFAQRGITTVSGLARGIDTVVHEETLKHKGRTIAVLGNGLNCHYPAENRKLEDRISNNGALVSEFSLNTGPDKGNFPRRNRLISGIALATLVVEADIKSGALITAKYSLEQGKDVFAVPGSIFSNVSKGANYLIKSGAALVEDAQEIIQQIKPLAEMFKKSNIRIAEKPGFEQTLNKSDKAVVEILNKNQEGLSIDTLASQMQMPVVDLNVMLFNLEMKGIIRQLPGKVYIVNYN